MKKLIIILTIIMSLSCVENAATKKTPDTGSTETKKQNNDSAADIALKFINSYVDNCNKMKESLGVVEWVNANSLTTTNFRKELKNLVEDAYKQDPELGLGFDPIFDAQDYPDKGFELASFDEKTNLVVLKGKNGTDFTLTAKMVLENDQWLVDGCGIVNIPEDKRITK